MNKSEEIEDYLTEFKEYIEQNTRRNNKSPIKRKDIANKTVKIENEIIEYPFTIKDITNEGEEDTILKYDYKKIKLSKKTIRLSVEALSFIIHLEGVPKNLFYYLLYNEVDLSTLSFHWDLGVRNRFYRFCETGKIKEPTSKTIEKAIKKLASFKLISNVKKGEYLLNPFLITHNNTSVRKKWFVNYCANSMKRNKIVKDELFPNIYELLK